MQEGDIYVLVRAAVELPRCAPCLGDALQTALQIVSYVFFYTLGELLPLGLLHLKTCEQSQGT